MIDNIARRYYNIIRRYRLAILHPKEVFRWAETAAVL